MRLFCRHTCVRRLFDIYHKLEKGSISTPLEGHMMTENNRMPLSEYMNSRLRVLINVSNGLSNFPRFRARALYALNRKLYYTITDHLNLTKELERNGVHTKNNCQ